VCGSQGFGLSKVGMGLATITGLVRASWRWTDMLEAQSSGTSLSFDQERRLLAEEWAQEHLAVVSQPHLGLAVRLRKPNVPTGRIEAALTFAVTRHRAFRTRFLAAESLSPQRRSQVIARAFHAGVSVGGLHRMDTGCDVHLTVLEQSVKPGALDTAISREIARPFLLGTAPLMRGTILTDGDDKYLILAADRLVADWPSMSFLLADIDDSLLGGAFAPPRAAHKVPALQPYQLRASAAHWKTTWQDLGVQLLLSDELPFPVPGSWVGPGVIGSSRLVLERRRAEATRQLAAAIGVGLPIITLAAASIALLHAAQRASMALWIDLRRPSVGDVGALSQSFAIEIDLGDSKSFTDAAKSVQASMVLAARHSEVPLDLIWRMTGTCGIPKAAQISFQHVVVRNPDRRVSFGSEAWPAVDSDPSMGLALRSYEDGRDIGMCANYSASRFAPESIDQLLAACDDVLSGALQEAGMSEDSVGRASFSLGSLYQGPADCYLCNRAQARLRHTRRGTA
jgi:hypothetical protein